MKDEAINFEKCEKLNVLVIKKIDDEESTVIALEIATLLQEFNHKMYLEGPTIKEMESELRSISKEIIVEFNPSKHEMEIELVITIGGDGTILWTANFFPNRIMPPLFTIDRGTLGYMCNFSMKTYKETVRGLLTDIKNKNAIFIERKFRIACELEQRDKQGTVLALNEFLIDRGPSPVMSKLDVYVEDQFLTTYEGDGIIIATPNGSTAYQLSAGGPIIHQTVPSVVITPICPRSMSSRPIILPMDMKITVKNGKGARNNAWFSNDGLNRKEITKDETLVIRKSDYYIPFIVDSSRSSLDNWLLRLKLLLGWNAK
eukprot:CAMPEP_0176441850 /NCGR_PEP_ID=MMETSP0127-20121128/21458_1 /TAXON_ID=938130 /ORGANISM="Platyophrya macrostoma, Strain WH" /LENGTH=315 /DNA_ID=CAMNT_0017826737 /DNA_START=150 /DNA_END=1097 /DNA_ORIENTATION=+